MSERGVDSPTGSPEPDPEESMEFVSGAQNANTGEATSDGSVEVLETAPPSPKIIEVPCPPPAPAVARFPRFTCINCQEDIKHARHIMCAVCDDYHFCAECFSYGAETGTHTSDHDYHVVDDGMFPIFTMVEDCDNGQAKASTRSEVNKKEWMAWEEIRLLKAMEQYQYGNWKDVAEVVGHRSPEECEEHYVQCYINGNLGELTWKTGPEYRGVESDTGEDTGSEEEEEEEGEGGGVRIGVIDHTVPPVDSEVVMDESDMTSLPLASVTNEEAAELGFLPRRQDFELEYNNNAEKLISNLQFDQSDDSLERAMKLVMVDSYHRQLVERNTRKRVALEYGLVQGFFGRPPPRTSFTAEEALGNKKKLWQMKEQELDKKLKPFSRFLPAGLMDSLRPCVLQEEFLRSRMNSLAKYMNHGCKTFKECVDLEEKLKNPKKRPSNTGGAGPSGYKPKNPKLSLPAWMFSTGGQMSSKRERALLRSPADKIRHQYLRKRVNSGWDMRKDRLRGRETGDTSVTGDSPLAVDSSETPGSPVIGDSSAPEDDPPVNDEMLGPSGSGTPPSGPMSISPGSRGKKRRPKTKLLTHKKICTLKRPHICPQHPAPPHLMND